MSWLLDPSEVHALLEAMRAISGFCLGASIFYLSAYWGGEL